MTKLLPQAILQSAERLPDKAAFKCGHEALNYGELATKIRQLAFTLRSCGVKRGDFVCVYLNRSIETVIALHGIMLAGAIYVPLNPRAPINFTRFQISEVAAKVAVSNKSQARTLKHVLGQDKATSIRTVIGIGPERLGLPTVETFDWPDVWQAPTNFSGLDDQRATDPAYLMYTSGSTGKPKGMLHTHRSGLGFARLMVDTFGISENDRFGNHAPIYFDISTPAYFSVPMVGATSIILTDAQTIFPASLSELVAQEKLTMWYSVPLALTQALEKGEAENKDWSSLRHVFYAGEPWAPKYIRRLMDHCPATKVTNLYGPAETNVCTYYTIPSRPKTDAPVPIGRTWNHTDMVILNDQGEALSGTGEGELLISSITMMEGYFERPELNKRSFWFRPRSSDPQVGQDQGAGTSDEKQKFYRTGDLVRLDEKGLLHFLGRKDTQFKIRGYRVEINAVENRLLAHPAVLEAVVIPVMSEEATLRLEVVVIAPQGNRPEAAELLNFAGEQLPWYAVPETVHFKDQLPRTGSDKVDRKALAALLTTDRSAP
ncbi:hypothetical protein CEQ90_06565 [Lewinellaceae bacterium SD302]|nr:hypothetical protein CEQ90_06565 [Lewinellaceae bacterium SD302]